MSKLPEEINPDLEKIKSLIVKVKELANRGIAGEKDSANRKLVLLLEKYNFKLKDIQSESNLKRIFRVVNKDDCVSILSQTIWDVVPDAKIEQHPRKLEVYCNLNAEQYIEVCEMSDYYWKLWCEEKKQSLTAFILVNKLGINGVSCGYEMNEARVNGIKKKMGGVVKGEYINKKLKKLS